MKEFFHKAWRFIIKVVIHLLGFALLAMIASELAGEPECMSEVRLVAEFILGAASDFIGLIIKVANYIISICK